MKWSALLTLVLVVSCSPGQPTSLDGARALDDDRAHPFFLSLVPLVPSSPESTDDLIRTWKNFVSDTPLPLRQGDAFTFVYYDFSHTLDQVFLEASFAPGGQKPLKKVGANLFYGVYSVTKPATARYRFSDGSNPLLDPFHPDILVQSDPWQPLVPGAATEPSAHWISGPSEPNLTGQDLTVFLPRSYRTNLAWSYPLVLVFGFDGWDWMEPLGPLMKDGALRPFLVISAGAKGDPRTLESRLLPWIRAHYRVSSLPADLIVVGWGPAVKAVQEAPQRPDGPKVWVGSPDQPRDASTWSLQAPGFFRSQFTEVAP